MAEAAPEPLVAKMAHGTKEITYIYLSNAVFELEPNFGRDATDMLMSGQQLLGATAVYYMPESERAERR